MVLPIECACCVAPSMRGNTTFSSSILVEVGEGTERHCKKGDRAARSGGFRVVIGHSNVNKIKYGKEAYIHLHIWAPEHRKVGIGAEFLRKSANAFIRKFALKSLYCEPYAENPAASASGLVPSKTTILLAGTSCYGCTLTYYALTGVPWRPIRISAREGPGSNGPRRRRCSPPTARRRV
jgi:hypothetical protein